MGKYVNITVPTCYRSHHFKGITLHPGVDLSIVPAGCGVPKDQLVFANTQTQPIVFLDGVTSGEIDADTPCPEYLQVVAG